MKIGLILECVARGADELVCRHFISLLYPDAQIEVAPLSRKTDLIRLCGESTSALLARGCDRVFIIWDLHPAWGGELCRKRDREAILASLHTAQIANLEKIALICIERELETWLITDRVALRKAFPSLSPSAFPSIRRLEQADAKTILTDYFKQTTGNRYNATEVQVRQLLKHLDDCSRLQRKCRSFQRFVDKLST
jgi:hypothetical protein